MATRLQRATAQLSAAAKRGADIAMLPERWAESPAAALAYKRLAAELEMAIGATYTAPWPIDPSPAAGLVRFLQSVSQFTSMLSVAPILERPSTVDCCCLPVVTPFDGVRCACNTARLGLWSRRRPPTSRAAAAGVNSSLALYSMNGTRVLVYSVPAGVAAEPTAGATPPVASLATKHGTVLVGALLGTDFMFWAPSRVPTRAAAKSTV